MDPRQNASDDLARWASERAPEVLARAEAEAVAALRDELLAAAVGPRARRPAVPPPSEREPRAPERVRAPDSESRAPESELRAPEPAEQGELLWAYCVLRASDPHPQDLAGVHRDDAIERLQAGDLAVLVSRVPRAAFAAEALRRNLNDLPWLETTARRHEAVLDAALAATTIVPLRMCTVYENAESARRMLEREHDALAQALEAVDGRFEWAIKVIVASDALMDAARAKLEPEEAAGQEVASQGEGGAYLLRQRRDREVRELATALADDLAHQVHARLQDWAIDAITRPPQNPELSGHKGEMVLNAAYLVDRAQTDELRRLVAELDEHHRELGAQIELTGPWPPYNFVPGGGAGTLA